MALSVEEQLPAASDLAETLAELQACAGSARHAPAFARLRGLAASPPRVLLLEGGSARERSLAAQYWALALACERRAHEQTTQPPLPGQAETPAAEAPGPCCTCSTCVRFLARMHRDFVYLDGLEGTIGIDDVRAVRAVLGEAPREARRRVVVLAEAQALSEAAANAMLKSLEEVRTDTVFMLLAPQRERLLPTLVSRSWVLTLAWPDPHGQVVDEWAACAAEFLHTGKGLFARTGARAASGAAVTAAGANALVIACQRALALAIAGRAEGDLARFFAGLPESRQRMADAILAEGQDSAASQVNAGLVVDWVMTRLFLLQPRR